MLILTYKKLISFSILIILKISSEEI